MNKRKRHWYNNGEKNILVAEGDIIPSGFVKGQSESFKKKNSEANKKRWKNTSDARKKEISEKISEGTKRMWSDLSHEQRQAREINRLQTRDSWSDDYKTKLSAKLSESAKINRAQTSREEYKRRSDKGFETRRLRNNFNSSSFEETFFTFLLEHFDESDIIREYSDCRYPFHCDFYIRSKDLFIELNMHWTHGLHPYKCDNKDDINEYARVVEKAKTSNFYKAYLDVWTKRDPEKQKFAELNNLNYKAIYNLDELEKLKEELV